MKKILIVSNRQTHPTNAGNRWWILSQAKLLSSLDNEVHFLFVRGNPLRTKIQEYNESVIATKRYWGSFYHEYKVPLLEKCYWSFKTMWNDRFNNRYHSVDLYYPKGLTAFVNVLNKEYNFDICIVNYVYLTKLFEGISIPCKAVSTHDCLAYKNLVIGEPVESITASEEAKALQRCPHIFALQDIEANYFQLLSPKSVVYKVYGLFSNILTPVVNNKNILFFSGNNRYNQHGINWFLKEVFPLIRQSIPECELVIGGGICNVITEKMLPDGVKIIGYVEDAKDFYGLGDVVINPVSQGTGLKIKTFEAIAYGKVTMTHPHSANGIYQKDNAPIFYSDKPQDWVKFLENIWTNPALIYDYKRRNQEYINNLNSHIIREYKKFLNIKDYD